MASTVIDRATGVALISAIKAPCVAATTANITLYGEQTIDGVAVAAGDRVLVKNQTAAAENGVYVVDTGGWDRAPDFDSSRDIQQYVRVYVGGGIVNATTEWVLTTSSPIPDTSNLLFSPSVGSIVRVENYSMPAAVDPVDIYISTAGTDTVSGPEHGMSTGAPFATFDAAINHAKKYIRFTGKLQTVTFWFEGGVDWGYIALGSNLDQGEDSFPFAIHIDSYGTGRARFTGVSLGTWMPNYLYAHNIKSGYFAVTRRNHMTVNDVSVISTVTVSYAFRAAFGGKLNVFGDINFENAVTFATALFYLQDMGYCSLENGDNPSIFPECNFINLANVTSPYIYRLVLGSAMYCPANPYADLGSLSSGAYYVDATSYSTQTQGAADLTKNGAVGGTIVARSGSQTSGWEKYADGTFRQWGTLAVTSAAVGVSSPASGALTFPTSFGANPRIRYNWALSTVIVAAPAPSTTGVQFVVNNLGAGAASFSIYWEATGKL